MTFVPRFRDIAEGTILSTKAAPLMSANVLLISGKLGEIQFCTSYTVRGLPSWFAYAYAYKN